MFKKKHIHVIILAGGGGVRMQTKKLKQFFLLEGRPISMHSITKFSEIIPNASLNIVLPEEKIKYWKKLCLKYNFSIPHTILIGGKTRFFSVKKSLFALDFNDNDLVVIHDAVRPFFSQKLIIKLIKSAKKMGHSVPVIEIKDSLRKINLQTKKTISVDRSKFLLTQTPQVFQADIIKMAYSKKSNKMNKTDDVSLIEEFVCAINLIYGEEWNFKITNQKDWELAKSIAPRFL